MMRLCTSQRAASPNPPAANSDATDGNQRGSARTTYREVKTSPNAVPASAYLN
jgi:hypothetical protein